MDDSTVVFAFRHGKSVETSPDTASTAVAGIRYSSATAATTCATVLDPAIFPIITDSKAPTSPRVLWPIAAHASVQPMSQKAVTTAIGVAKPQLVPSAEEHMMAQAMTRTVGIQPGAATNQSPAFKLGAYEEPGKGRYVVVNKNGSISLAGTSSAPLQCIVPQASGKTGPMPRCVILRPICTAASTTSLRQGTVTTYRPNIQTVTVPSSDKSTADKKQQQILVPAVHTNVRHLVMPRAIPQATFKISTPMTGCQVIRAKTVAVPRLQSSAASTSSGQHGLPVITPGQLTVAAETGKDSPLSCIQTLVANAGSAAQLLAIGSKIPEDYNSNAVSQAGSDENDAILQLNVSGDNTDSHHGFVSTAADVKGGFNRKRLSATDDFENKVAKQS